jgi:deazaflavin-dependent oxidoreductase (nitroreductase family)
VGIPEVDPTAGSKMLKVGARLLRPRPVRYVVRHVVPRIDPPLLRLTNGRVSSAMVTPELLLTSIGARSGQQRVTPLTYFTDDGRVIVVASNYGGRRHPAWYHNVKRNPQVTLAAGGYEGTFVGEEITGAERDRLWRIAKEWITSYADYEKLTQGRTIPILAFTEV